MAKKGHKQAKTPLEGPIVQNRPKTGQNRPKLAKNDRQCPKWLKIVKYCPNWSGNIKKEVFVEQPRLHRVRLPSYRVSRLKLSLGKTTFYTKIQKSAIKMTFETIIGPKNTEHYEPSTFRFTNQKPPKITLYQINLGQNPKK